MKKNNEYTPQFVLTETNDEQAVQRCKSCGKQTVALHKGFCFDCREKARAEEIQKNEKGIEKYLEWTERKSRDLYKRFNIGGLILSPFAKYGFATIWFVIALNIFLASLIGINNFETTDVIIMSLFAVAFVAAGLLNIKFLKKRRIEKYYKYSDMTIYYEEANGWRCPCCKGANLYKKHCETCGITPKLIEKKG